MTPRGIFGLVCLGVLFSVSARAQQWDWVVRFSGDGTLGTAVGVDDAQDVYAAGIFTGTNYIGTNRIASEAGTNVFIAKFASFGVPLWTMTARGALTKMLVASNGSVFVCGALAFDPPAAASSISNIFLARIDEGKVTWTEPLPENVGCAASMAFGPDETIYVLNGTTNQAFVRRFTQVGELLGASSVQLDSMTFFGISVPPNGHLYLAGRYATNDFLVSMLAQISLVGDVEWIQEIRGGLSAYKREVIDIAAALDGGVVSVGYDSTPLPQRSAIVVKHSVVGTQEWYTGVFAYFKRFHSAEAVAVDARGNIHVTGYTDGSYYNADRLLILTLAPTGEHLWRESIGSYVRGHRNAGAAIAVDKDGAVFVAGDLQGQTIFGTNRLPDGSGGFVARRSTLLPQLVQERAGDHVILSWPTSAFSMALQESADGTNWSFVTIAPRRNGWRNQTIVAATTGPLYRLLRTNEPPFNHAPRLFPFLPLGVVFLDYSNVVITGASDSPASRLRVYFDDEDEEPLSVTWTNLRTGQPITNAISVFRNPGVDDWSHRHPSYYDAAVTLDSNMFSPGRHLVSVSVSDGKATATRNYPEFEVITSEMAVEEFLTSIAIFSGNRARREALALLDGYRRAKNNGWERLAERRWKHFQRQLARVTSISEEQRSQLANAAEVVKPFLAEPR